MKVVEFLQHYETDYIIFCENEKTNFLKKMQAEDLLSISNPINVYNYAFKSYEEMKEIILLSTHETILNFGFLPFNSINDNGIIYLIPKYFLDIIPENTEVYTILDTYEIFKRNEIDKIINRVLTLPIGILKTNNECNKQN